MGDRFYVQQKNYKPPRRLKKDVIATFESIVGSEVPGLDRMTISSIEHLTVIIAAKIASTQYKKALRELAK